jgi:hypothetical protein
MTKTASEKRSQQRWARKDKIVKGFVSVITEAFRYADEYLWTSEALWKHRNDHILGADAYKKLPYSDKRYLDGVWDTLNKLHEQKNHVWTHVLDGERFQSDDPAWRQRRKGREHEINTDTSYFCYKRTLDKMTVFVPVREEHRAAEFARDTTLPGKVARLLPVSATRTVFAQKHGLI